MGRYGTFALLVTTGVALADGRVEGARGAAQAAAQERTEAVHVEAGQAPRDATEPTPAPAGATQAPGDLAEALPDAAQAPADPAEAPSDAAPAAAGDSPSQTDAETGPKVISGMSILGNQEAPTSLVLVPWKSSELGTAIGISTILDDSRQPVDRDVFMRSLRYYEIRSEGQGPRP